MNKGFIDRSPLWFAGGVFMLIVGVLAKSIPLSILAVFDLGISFVSFFNPDLSDNKSVKFFVFIVYGALILWTILWLMTKLP